MLQVIWKFTLCSYYLFLVGAEFTVKFFYIYLQMSPEELIIDETYDVDFYEIYW